MKLKTTSLHATLAVCIIVPFANDIFLAALPQISQIFHTEHIQLILSVFLLGLAVAQPLYGPLSDRFGRKPVLLGGLVIYLFASVLTVATHSYEMLLVSRFIQAIGACSAIISALAITRDIFPQERMVFATSAIMAVIGVCPVIAPFIGSVLTQHWGWRAPFGFLLVLGICFFIIVSFCFTESQKQKNLTALQYKHLINNYLSLIKNNNYRRYCLISALSYGIFFSYFSVAPVFIIEKLHFSLISFGSIIAINALGMLAMAFIAPQLNKYFGLERLIFIGTGIITLGGLLLWLINSAQQNNIFTLMIPIFLMTMGVGLIRPTASAGAMTTASPKIAGSAAAGFCLTSFLGGAILTALTTQWVHSIASFGVFIAGFGTVAILMGIQLNWKKLSSCEAKA